jgi:hypothetical protein
MINRTVSAVHTRQGEENSAAFRDPLNGLGYLGLAIICPAYCYHCFQIDLAFGV